MNFQWRHINLEKCTMEFTHPLACVCVVRGLLSFNLNSTKKNIEFIPSIPFMGDYNQLHFWTGDLWNSCCWYTFWHQEGCQFAWCDQVFFTTSLGCFMMKFHWVQRKWTCTKLKILVQCRVRPSIRRTTNVSRYCTIQIPQFPFAFFANSIFF